MSDIVADYQKRSGVAVRPVSAILSSSATTHLRLARSVRTDRKRTCRRARHARIPAQVSRAIDRPDPVTVAAPGGQSRVVVARPGTRPHLHKTCAPGVLPLHKMARQLNVVRWHRPSQVDLAHT